MTFSALNAYCPALDMSEQFQNGSSKILIEVVHSDKSNTVSSILLDKCCAMGHILIVRCLV